MGLNITIDSWEEATSCQWCESLTGGRTDSHLALNEVTLNDSFGIFLDNFVNSDSKTMSFFLYLDEMLKRMMSRLVIKPIEIKVELCIATSSLYHFCDIGARLQPKSAHTESTLTHFKLI